MFDLKYYEMLSRTEKYFDEDKGNAMSRQYLHNFFLNKIIYYFMSDGVWSFPT